MVLSTLVGVGLARILFFGEFAGVAADITGASIGFAAHSQLAAREHL
jgi:hypothetical protein